MLGIIGGIVTIIMGLLAFGTKDKIGIAVFIISLVLTIVGFANTDWSDGSKKSSYSSSSYSSSTDRYGNSKYDAIAAAEKYVKNNLKSPTSARFSGESATLSGSSWTVTGTVDAQNSFGATIRNSFRVTITFTAKNRFDASGNIY